MNSNVHKRTISRIVGLFDKPIIQNNLRGTYVEFMISELLGPTWRVTSDDWSSWDLEHDDGTKLEVKQSACMQTWEPSSKGYSPPSFSIRTPKVVWSGAKALTAAHRPANVYVFAWHGDNSDKVDQRDTAQWQFFVVPTPMLPRDQKTIGLGSLRRLVSPTKDKKLAVVIENIRQGGTIQ